MRNEKWEMRKKNYRKIVNQNNKLNQNNKHDEKHLENKNETGLK